MDYVENLDILGFEVKEIPCIVGKGAPTINVNAVGLLYMDEDTGEVYKRLPEGWALLVPKIDVPDTPNIYVYDSVPSDLSAYKIGDVIMVKE